MHPTIVIMLVNVFLFVLIFYDPVRLLNVSNFQILTLSSWYIFNGVQYIVPKTYNIY